jgi:hypothetical protein
MVNHELAVVTSFCVSDLLGFQMDTWWLDLKFGCACSVAMLMTLQGWTFEELWLGF